MYDANSAWAKDRAHVLHPYTDFSSFHDEGSQVITGAEGMYVIDSDGQRFHRWHRGALVRQYRPWAA